MLSKKSDKKHKLSQFIINSSLKGNQLYISQYLKL